MEGTLKEFLDGNVRPQTWEPLKKRSSDSTMGGVSPRRLARGYIWPGCSWSLYSLECCWCLGTTKRLVFHCPAGKNIGKPPSLAVTFPNCNLGSFPNFPPLALQDSLSVTFGKDTIHFLNDRIHVYLWGDLSLLRISISPITSGSITSPNNPNHRANAVLNSVHYKLCSWLKSNIYRVHLIKYRGSDFIL